MNTFGKVLAGLVVVLAAGAVYVTTTAYSTQKGWQEVAQKNQATIEENARKIAEQTDKLNSKQAELARIMIGWDRHWNEVNARVENGVLNLAIGTPQGVKVDQRLWVFGVNPDKTSILVGEFRVARVADAGCQATPVWRVRPGDINVEGFKARVRTLIPTQFAKRLADLDQQLLATELGVQTNEQELERQKQLITDSDKLIAERMLEIKGNPELAGQPLPDVVVLGLLKAMDEEEAARNKALLEADDLMRALKHTRDRFQQILKENKKLADSLPRPEPQEPAVGATGR